MKKRIYRGVNVKKVDGKRLADAVRGKRMVFGLDVAKEAMVGSVAVDRDEVILNVKWSHPSETKDLVELVAGLPAASIEVAMEPSGTYGDALKYQFALRGVPVYRVSPKRSHDAAEVFDGVPSWHDVKSAGLLARLHLDGASEPWRDRTDAERELAAAIRTMEMHDCQENNNTNRLEALLARHWPEVTQHLRLKSATLVAMIKHFGSPQRVSKQASQARALIRRVGRGGVKEETIEAIVNSASMTVGVPVIEAEARMLQALAEEILRCRKAANKARAEVERLSEAHEAAGRMGQTIGKATAAVLVSKVGDPQEYASASSLVKSLGLNLKERSSGKHKGQLKITKRGPSVCRYYLYLAALRLIQDDPVVRAWYGKKVARDGGRMKNRAVIAVVRKLVKGLWHVARGEPFDSRLLFDTSKLNLLKA